MMTAIDQANEKIKTQLIEMGYRPVTPLANESRYDYHIRLQDQWIDATDREVRRLLTRDVAHG